jgi:hypothetical protein
MMNRSVAVGLVGLVMAIALASPARAVPTTYYVTPGPQSTLDTVQLLDIMAPFTPTPCPVGLGNCLVGAPIGITSGEITVDLDTNQLLNLSLFVAGPATLALGGLNGYTSAVLVGITFQSQGPVALGSPFVPGIVSVSQLFLTPDPFGLNPYVYSATAAPDVDISFGPNGVTLGLTGVDVGIFTDVNGSNPVLAKADFQLVGTVPEPSAALLFGVALASAGMAARRRAVVAC